MKKIFFLFLTIYFFTSDTGAQNLDTIQSSDSLLFNINQGKEELLATEPFDPPRFLFEAPLQKKYLLEPPKEPLIPQINPTSLKVPDLVLKPEPIFEKDFIISYKFLLNNQIPQGEKYNISEPLRTMKKNMVLDYQCSVDIFLSDDIEVPDVLDILLKELLWSHKDEVLDCLYKSGVKIRDDGFSNQNMAQSKTLLVLPPKWVRVSLQNGFLIIKVFKEKK
ncbi:MULTISPECIES: hypothetical protein [unclassified Helicobacter]|uniref:hypothetical protein n=1 Tax=unclassified Helicobacter TaxID=2593540 RepID=UPI000CF116A7|nr:MULTISPECIES: hypothetical protein [unclassified Helicobacter]